MDWTREKLCSLVKDLFQDARLIIVANREPYMHQRDGESIRCIQPASGLVTALDPVQKACGGTWIAHGAGDADHETADGTDRLQVPPENPSYTLRRVWLTKEEEDGYYYGFSNESLWPLCHIAYTRPVFDASDWEQYKQVNAKFADAVLQEIEGQRAIVFVQDYHFALLPRLVKDKRPDAVVCQFWHIPWPNREAFRICPWREDILHGLLGNDLLGFHIQYHCNNFLDTVDRQIEARVDYERFSVTRGGKDTLVKPFPISLDTDLPQIDGGKAGGLDPERIRRQLRIRDQAIMVGVDRIDYTKGIPERFRAVKRLIEKYPEHREKFVFVQLGAPSRTHIKHYRMLNDEIDELVEEINWRHGTIRWKPIVFLRDHHDAKRVFSFYRAAHVCVVSSLHDGMNLVAKEFVAAREDLRGVLVLSHFTGAAREFNDALLVNPYATDRFADALHEALNMPPEEQERRMRLLREQVAENNVYKWAGMILTDAARLLKSQR